MKLHWTCPEMPHVRHADQPMTEQWTHVYVIYSADVVTDSPSAIEEMSPAEHAPAVADAFTLTEGDDQYGYKYLASEGADDRYLAFADREDNHDDDSSHQGQHRKWAAELTREQWRLFADAYLIDLDDDELPTDYTDTLGSITEYGHIPAIAVDMREGWDCPAYGNNFVIDAQMYLSFGGDK